MARFVYYIYDDDYDLYTINGVLDSEKSVVLRPFKSKLAKRIFKYHNSQIINSIIELPFKKLWFNNFISKFIKEDEEIYFMFFESFHLSYSKEFLSYLRRKYNNAKFIFVFQNPLNEKNNFRLNNVRKYYDKVISFVYSDAIKHKFLFYEYMPFKLPKTENIVVKNDVFFVGANKGRLSRLYEVYEKLTSAGLKCKFFITGVNKVEMKYEDDIVFNKIIPYREVLRYVQESNCILEILQNQYSYISLRTAEALQYKKKLLTTNMNIKEKEFYDKSIIQYFDAAQDIDISFFRNDDDMNFPTKNLWDVVFFEDFIVNSFYNK